MNIFSCFILISRLLKSWFSIPFFFSSTRRIHNFECFSCFSIFVAYIGSRKKNKKRKKNIQKKKVIFVFIELLTWKCQNSKLDITKKKWSRCVHMDEMMELVDMNMKSPSRIRLIMMIFFLKKIWWCLLKKWLWKNLNEKIKSNNKFVLHVHINTKPYIT